MAMSFYAQVTVFFRYLHMKKEKPKSKEESTAAKEV